MTLDRLDALETRIKDLVKLMVDHDLNLAKEEKQIRDLAK